MEPSIANIRREYTGQPLTRKNVAVDPMKQFDKWFDEALRSEIKDPSAMTLSTADESGHPSARIVLLKGAESGKFIFYTNYNSQKGDELAQNPFAALTFYWQELNRQIRIQGSVVRTTLEVSKSYFKSRPRKSKIGAWISPQSKPIPTRMYLMRKFVNHSIKLMGGNIALPSYWGGYALTPARIEFWQGRPNRLHDRINYKLLDGNWHIERLAP